MTTDVSALSAARAWHDFWAGAIGGWILTSGMQIALLLIGGLLGARFISWTAQLISRRIDARFTASDALVRSESVKHGQAVASVISYVAIALLGVLVFVQITDVLQVPVSSLVAPAAVLGAALGFGAQRVVQDLLSGFFIITEKQYGLGDLVELTMGTSGTAMGTVEEVTLRVTKLRTADGEVYTISNGQIFKTLNLSKEWARAVVDIPLQPGTDLIAVHEVLDRVCEAAVLDPDLRELLLDKPELMGVESIEVGTVNLRMVARTLPGKQFEAGRRLRMLVVGALNRAGIVTTVENSVVVPAQGPLG
jgi:small-conductance mechanosensitive channel